MKKLFYLTALTVSIFTISSCNKDDSPTIFPLPINEEELITTVTTTLTNGANVITLRSRDLDGDGPTDPVVTVSGNLMANTVYTGRISLLDETKTPIDDITEEIETSVQEKLDHQFFFGALDGLFGTFLYTDQDANAKPVGINFTYTTGTASSGKLNVILKHLPNKNAAGVAAGNIANSGGATDVDVKYSITIQ